MAPASSAFGTSGQATQACGEALGGYRPLMKLLRSVTVIGIAKKVYDEARKPQNQAKIKSTIERARSKRRKSR